MSDLFEDDMLRQAHQLAMSHNGPGGSAFRNVGRLNAYVCDDGCEHFIVTVDRDPGVTPFMLKCGNCGAFAHSKFYRVRDTLIPTHEWYRPYSLKGIDLRLFDHLEKGGLILRPIDGAQDKWLPQAHLDPAAQAKLRALQIEAAEAASKADGAIGDLEFIKRALAPEPQGGRRERRAEMARERNRK